MTRGRIFIVDDDRNTCELLEEGLRNRGFSTEWRLTAEDALSAIDTSEPDVVLTDLNLRGTSGLELCKRSLDRWPDVPVILITAFGSLPTAIEAIRVGAYDFLTKPFDLDVVALALDRAVRNRALHAEVRRLRSAFDRSPSTTFERLGSSGAMRPVIDMVERVASADATVLVYGESGTGKELVARALHERSHRSAEPFVAINCSAIPENLLEAELFGHARGAFTDARSARTGLFVAAGAGTLFLDEIGDLPATVQPKLLRALQERRVRPVGSDAEVPFEARIVAATHKDLETEVAAGRFRQDLFFRVNVIQINLPPLRARGSDVLGLAQRFIEESALRSRKDVQGLSPQAAEKLLRYDWPGNVRELQNCIERAVAVARATQIIPDDLPDRVRDTRPKHVVFEAAEPSDLVPLEEIERRYILRVIDAVSGNKKLAAQVLGLDRSTLYRKLEKWGV